MKTSLKRFAAHLALLTGFGVVMLVTGYAIGVASFMLGAAHERGEFDFPPRPQETVQEITRSGWSLGFRVDEDGIARTVPGFPRSVTPPASPDYSITVLDPPPGDTWTTYNDYVDTNRVYQVPYGFGKSDEWVP